MLSAAKHLNAIRYSPLQWLDPDGSGLTTSGYVFSLPFTETIEWAKSGSNPD
jgi:hypothetical protein